MVARPLPAPLCSASCGRIPGRGYWRQGDSGRQHPQSSVVQEKGELVCVGFCSVGRHERLEEEWGQGRLRHGWDWLCSRGIRVGSAEYASLLRRCADAKALSQGRWVHACILGCGLIGDRFLSNLLVQMYGNCGRLEDARAVFDGMGGRNVYSWNIMITAYGRNGYWEDSKRLFDKMNRRDVVSWNAMIGAYAQSGLGKEAIELFRLMGVQRVKPTKITYVSVLDACGGLVTLAEGKEIHANIIDSGVESDLFVGTALINMYGKCGRPDYAMNVFHKMGERDVMSWNAMIAAYVRNGNGKEALRLFRQMQVEGVGKPDRFSFINILDACASVASIGEGKEIHATLIEGGLDTEVVLGNSLINMYAKCGFLDDARNVFDKLQECDVVSWNSMISMYAQNGHEEQALELFRQMDLEGVTPDRVTFISILNTCVSNASLVKGKVIHSRVLHSGLESDVAVGNAVLNMYGKCRSPNDARRVFDSMSLRDVVSWTAMISAYSQNGECKQARELSLEMDVQGVKLDKVALVSILDVCAELAELELGKAIHANLVDSGLELDVVMENALVNMYSKCRSLNDARCMFDKMCQRDVVSWTTMITVYMQNGHCMEGLELFRQMNLKGVKPDKIAFISILDACANLAALTAGKEVHGNLVNCGFEPEIDVGNAIVNMYGKCGSLDDARNVFDNMPVRNVVSWTAMIAAYGHSGYGAESLKLFQQMVLEGVKPDNVTFIHVLTACSHVGLLDDGWHHFVSMSMDHGISPVVEHYACMVDLLGRAGHLDQAMDFINNMQFEPNTVAWMNLLGACRSHSGIEQAEHVAECIFELDPKDAAPYVLLSNIYAAASRWDDVAKLREAMKNRSVKKQPGHSCIEVKNRVHEFVVGDSSHPQKKRSMLS